MFLGGRAFIEEYILEILKNEMIESSKKLSNKCEIAVPKSQQQKTINSKT